MCAGRVPSGLRAIRLWPLCPLAMGLTGLSLMLGALCTCLDEELQGVSGFFLLPAPALGKAVLSAWLEGGSSEN